MTESANHPLTPRRLDDPVEVERYARLLAEAERNRGVSPAREAWQRLRRNRIALAALVFLGLLALAALFTPLLPLQSPIQTATERVSSRRRFGLLFIEYAGDRARRSAGRRRHSGRRDAAVDRQDSSEKSGRSIAG